MYGNGDTSQDPMNLPQGAWPQGNRIGMRRPAGNMNLGVSAQAQSVPFGGPQGGGSAGESGGQGPISPDMAQMASGFPNFSTGPSGVAGPGVSQSNGPLDRVQDPFHPTVAHAVGTLGLHSPPQQWYRQGGGAASVEQDPGVAGPGDPARLLDPVQAFLRSQKHAQMSPLLSQLSGSGTGGYFQSGG